MPGYGPVVDVGDETHIAVEHEPGLYTMRCGGLEQFGRDSVRDGLPDEVTCEACMGVPL